MTFLEALKQATMAAFHGDLAGAEAILAAYFCPAETAEDPAPVEDPAPGDGGVTTNDTGDNGGAPH